MSGLRINGLPTDPSVWRPLFATKCFRFTLNPGRKGEFVFINQSIRSLTSSGTTMPAMRLAFQQPTCLHSISRPFLTPLGRVRRCTGATRPHRTGNRYDILWVYWHFSNGCGRSRRRLRLLLLSDAPSELQNGQETSEQCTSLGAKYNHYHPPYDAGPWVVCSGCFRNWTRQGNYCWDCGYGC